MTEICSDEVVGSKMIPHSFGCSEYPSHESYFSIFYSIFKEWFSVLLLLLVLFVVAEVH